MIILTLRTDKPEAEIGLYDDHKLLEYTKWQAHHQLSKTIHQQIKNVVILQGLTLQGVEGVVVYGGPGSFTGLRIGVSVANALGFGLGIPVVASSGEKWIKDGVQQLKSGKTNNIALPIYGSPARTTKQRK